MARILFITTNNLSTNPRLLKEVKLAISLGHNPEVVAFKLGGWSDENDQLILNSLNIRVHYLSSLKNHFVQWFTGSLVHWINRRLQEWMKNNRKIMAYAESKRSYPLIRFLKRRKEKYDLVVAHNLGALYPAWWLASKNNIPFNFDVEDYYPGEKAGGNQERETQLRRSLMNTLMPDASFITCASPMIRDRIVEEFKLKADRAILVNNTFHAEEFSVDHRTEASGRIRLVWFSQKIGYNRGLESFIKVLDDLKDFFDLTLIGFRDQKFYNEFISDRAEFIHCIDPMPQQKLHQELSRFDIGLAVEDAATDLNRDICLTNKIWAYYLSGLYILATDTTAQREFMDRRNGHGLVFVQNKIEDSLLFIRDNIETIRKNRESRQEGALKESFKAEIPKLVASWNKTS